MTVTLDGIRDVRVYQNRDGYRFSVDALLLSSFVHSRHARIILDLGAGSGIIGLLLARRYPKARVTLVELQESLFRLAGRNIALNGLADRVEALRGDIRAVRDFLPAGTADLVVCNPPFRKTTSGRLSRGDERAIARHEIAVRFGDVAAAAAFLLKARGRFCLIFHPERILEAVDAMRRSRLEPKRVRFVHNDVRSGSKIVLIDAVKEGNPGLKIERPLFLYDPEGEYTPEVRSLYAAADGTPNQGTVLPSPPRLAIDL